MTKKWLQMQEAQQCPYNKKLKTWQPLCIFGKTITSVDSTLHRKQLVPVHLTSAKIWSQQNEAGFITALTWRKNLNLLLHLSLCTHLISWTGRLAQELTRLQTYTVILYQSVLYFQNHMVSWYTHKCNVIYTHKKSTAIPVSGTDTTLFSKGYAVLT